MQRSVYKSAMCGKTRRRLNIRVSVQPGAVWSGQRRWAAASDAMAVCRAMKCKRAAAALMRLVLGVSVKITDFQLTSRQTNSNTASAHADQMNLRTIDQFSPLVQIACDHIPRKRVSAVECTVSAMLTTTITLTLLPP